MNCEICDKFNKTLYGETMTEKPYLHIEYTKHVFVCEDCRDKHFIHNGKWDLK